MHTTNSLASRLCELVQDFTTSRREENNPYALALALAEDALQSVEFREQLLRDVTRGRDYLRTANLPGAQARSGELNFLMTALRRMN